MKHWASDLIGRPWFPGANGPKEFDCWGLVRHAVRLSQGIQLPAIATGDEQEPQVAAIKRAAQSGGWHRDEGPAQEHDIVLLTGRFSKRHVGLMVRMLQGLRLLHADGCVAEVKTKHGVELRAVGSVLAQPLRDVEAEGYRSLEIWRRR